MLYVTTRSDDCEFSPMEAMSFPCAPTGGFFVPKEVPNWKSEDIQSFSNMCFSETVSEVVNLLFGTKLNKWAIEFAIGRQPVRFKRAESKIWIAELWNNPAWKFDRLATGVEKAILQSDQVNREPTEWMKIAARIAVLCGICGHFLRENVLNIGETFNVSVPAGDFSAPIAVKYACSWGLPIGEIICSTNSNDAVWNLLSKGELRASSVAAQTHTNGCDIAVPLGLERLIYSLFGREEANRFSECCRTGVTYRLDDHSDLSDGFFVSVVGEKRMEAVLLNLYNTFRYFADPHTALAYAGIMDYRSKVGENRLTVVLSEIGPIHSAQYLSNLLAISKEELLKRICFIEE